MAASKNVDLLDNIVDKTTNGDEHLASNVSPPNVMRVSQLTRVQWCRSGPTVDVLAVCTGSGTLALFTPDGEAMGQRLHLGYAPHCIAHFVKGTFITLQYCPPYILADSYCTRHLLNSCILVQV